MKLKKENKHKIYTQSILMLNMEEMKEASHYSLPWYEIVEMLAYVGFTYVYMYTKNDKLTS